MTSATAAEMADRRHRRAVRFFWTWLIAATAVSLAGNVAHALITAQPASRPLAAAVATVPPAVLLAAVHGVAVLVRVGASGAVYRAAVAATAALGVGAFALSFVALRDLAVLAGSAPHLAPVLPLVVDLAVAVATFALVAVGDRSARRPRGAGRAARETAPPIASVTAPPAAPAAALAAPRNRAISAPGAPSGAAPGLAAQLVAAGVTRQPVEVVEAILAAREGGAPLNRIAASLGVHHSAVKRVLEAARGYREDRLLPAG